MQGQHIQACFTLPGTLAANITIVWTAPFASQLVHVSAVASNATPATLQIGNTTTPAAYMVATAIGQTWVPAEFDLDDFVDDQFPHIPAGTVIQFLLDYDGAGGLAADDVTIIATLLEG